VEETDRQTDRQTEAMQTWGDTLTRHITN